VDGSRSELIERHGQSCATAHSAPRLIERAAHRLSIVMRSRHLLL
jgi:hypothetical protein